MNTIITQKSSWSVVLEYLKVVLYKRITRRALPIFVRGGDVISANPMVNGSHEQHVAATLEDFANDGYSDFLLDIGANIGLTSSAVGNVFDKIILFEPNPLCIGVLEANLAISLVNTPFEIRRYGLGSSNEKPTLKIPRSNWGGAHIVSEDNAYSGEILLAKDGFSIDDDRNYITQKIEIRNAVDVLKDIFEQFRIEGNLTGSIKIDVEGFELVVLQAIAVGLPHEMGLSIIFEYWADKFPAEEILSAFQGRAQLFAVIKTPRVAGSQLRKLISLLFAGKQAYSRVPWKPGLQATDFVLKVRPN
jgi:FkbM family methyltransferase